MSQIAVLAEFFRYPTPDHLDLLQGALDELPEGEIRQVCAAFLKEIKKLTLGEWEELYTRTLDINPPAAPYVGYQVWGESYQRGNFLARMNHAIRESGIDASGELPDHLLPVLRYLGTSAQPIPELLEALPPAVKKMRALLHKVDPANPYNFLLEAVRLTTNVLIGDPT